MSDREFREELASIARATLRYIERERAAGGGELLTQSAVKAAVASGARGGEAPAERIPGAVAPAPPAAPRSAPAAPAAAAHSAPAAPAAAARSAPATPPAPAAAAKPAAAPRAPTRAEVDLFGKPVAAPRASVEEVELPSMHEALHPTGAARAALATEALPILEQVATEVRACRKCGLCETRTNAVPGVGSAQSGIVFVGEAPGAEEDRRGEPFVGRAGELLTRIIAAMEQKQLIPGVPLTRETVYICNVLKCRPPENRNPLPHEIEMCSPYLHRQLDALKPRIICCLGKFAAELLVGVKGTIGGLRGKIYRYRGAKLIVTYHPAACLRNPAYKDPVWKDMQLLAREYLTD